MSDFDLKELLCERHAFLNRKKWHDPSLKPKRWDLKAQLLNIPQEFQTPIPSYIPPLKERSICRICGFENKEPNFFYDQEGYPTYSYCNSCGGQSGYHDFDAESILKRQEAVEICKNMYDQYLD